MTRERIERAKKYAYHYFFRRTMQVSSLESIQNAWPPFKVSKKSLENLIDNNDKGLEVMSQCIINNNKFIQDI